MLFAGVCYGLKESVENVDTKNPIIFGTSNNSPNDYFGHGVAIGKQMAIIGGPGSDKHGQIFKCEFDGKQGRQIVSCQKLPGKFCIRISQKYLEVSFSPLIRYLADNLTSKKDNLLSFPDSNGCCFETKTVKDILAFDKNYSSRSDLYKRSRGFRRF